MPTHVRPSLRPLGVAAILATSALSAAACRTTGARGSAATAVVSFVNQGLDQASVYAIGPSGDWFRMGTVLSGQTARLRLPPGVVASGRTINIVARPLASSRLATSGPVTIAAGDTLTITLPPSQSVLSVLPGLP